MGKPLHTRFGFINHILERRYRYLLFALLGFIVLPSFFFKSPFHREVSYVCLSAVLIMGVYAVHTTVRNLFVGQVAAMIVILINASGLFIIYALRDLVIAARAVLGFSAPETGEI